jgi:hypothetical protein
MSHSSEPKTSISAPPSLEDLRAHEPLTGFTGLAVRACIRRIPHAAVAVLLAVGAITLGIKLPGGQDHKRAIESEQAQAALPDTQAQGQKMLLVPPAFHDVKVEKSVPVQQTVEVVNEDAPTPISTPPKKQVAKDFSPLPAVPNIEAEMSSIDMGELASAVDSLGIRTEQLEEAIPQAELALDQKLPQDTRPQENVPVAATPVAKQAPARAMTVDDAEVHKRLLARLDEVRAEGDANGVKSAKAELDMFEATLDTPIEFRIVDRSGEKPGFWRTLVNDAKTKQFFVVVEAVVDGKAVNWAVRDADTGKVVSRERFGLRVDEKTFSGLSADKKDDGRIDNMVVGLKPVGRITPVWSIKTDGETITGF